MYFPAGFLTGRNLNAPRAQGRSWYVCSVAYAHAFVKRRLEEAGIQGFSFWYICFCYVDRKLILLSILHRDSCIFHARLAHKRCISWLIIHVFLRQNEKKWSRLTCLACIVRKSRRVRRSQAANQVESFSPAACTSEKIQLSPSVCGSFAKADSRARSGLHPFAGKGRRAFPIEKKWSRQTCSTKYNAILE